MKLLSITLCFLSFLSLTAQTYFNEWLDYDQTYYKFRIAEDGLYRIPYSALQQADLAQKSPEGFHLFSRGEEIPIYVSSNEIFGSEDFIEFYGQKNDGSFDTQLFQNPDWQLTDRKSLFTDSIGYYLMWDNGFEGERMEVVENNLSGELPEKEEYFMYESGLVHTNIFNEGKPTEVTSIAYTNDDGQYTLNTNFSNFEQGEGFTGTTIVGEKTNIYQIPTLGVYKEENAPLGFFEAKMAGKSNEAEIENDHSLILEVNDIVALHRAYEGYNTPVFNASIEPNFLNDIRTKVAYKSVGEFFTNPFHDLQSVIYTFLIYPRYFDFSVEANEEVKDATEFYFELQHLNQAYFEVFHFNGGNQSVLYDLNNQQRFEIAASNDLYKIHLPESPSMELESRKLFLANTTEGVIRTIDELQSIQFTDYQKLATQGNYIIISHPSLRTGNIDWIEAYGNYRSTPNGGSYKVVIADIEELYDQFTYGIPKHPLAIRHFVNFAVDKWGTNPEYLFLIGKGVGYRSSVSPSDFNANLIPTFGHMPSDIMLTARDVFDFRPQLGVGRLSARMPEDVQNYFNKIQQYEHVGDCTIADRAWRKHMLFQGAGSNDHRVNLIKSFLNPHQSIVEDNSFGAKVLDIQIGRNFQGVFNTRPFLEQGLGLISYLGNGTGQWWKTDILENPTDYQQATPRYPFAFSACAFTGDIFKSPNIDASMPETWVGAKGKGFIGFLGTLTYAFWETNSMYLDELYQQISQTNYNQPIGKCIKETIENIYINVPNSAHSNRTKSTIQEFIFEGDPAFIIGGGFDRPEYVIENNYTYSFVDTENGYVRKTENRNDVEVLDVEGNILQPKNNLINVIEENKNLQLKVRVTNLGKAIEENFTIQVLRRILGEIEVELIAEKSVASPFYEKNHIIDLPYLDSTVEDAIYEYFVQIDPNNDIPEDCEDNNEVVLPLRFSTCAGLAEQYANLEITNVQSDYCANDPAIQLQANIGGGTFVIEQIGGPAYNVNVFQPSQLGGGDFVVRYTVTDVETGCAFTTETFTTIVEPIAVIESISLIDVCVGDVVQINTTPAEGQYVWNFGSGGDLNFTGTPENPILSWNTPGEKWITLKVFENGCESETVSQLIMVYPQVAENFPISCEANDNSIYFEWDAEGAAAYNILVNDVWVTQLSGEVNNYTVENLSSDEVVSIEVIAVPSGTCKEILSTLTCKTICSGEAPVLDMEDIYCGSNSVLIEAPTANGLFRIENPDGSTLNVEGSFFSSIFQDGISTVVFEYSEGECFYTSNEYQVIVSNPQVSIEGNTAICPDNLFSLIEVPETFAAYQWNVSNANNYILGVEEAGNYAVTVT
ncbi:MAG: C25 family cysteine peptidase, partial [Chitinophagales bacterium]